MTHAAHSIRDQISFLCSPAKVRVPAFQVINRLDGQAPGSQLMGAAVAVVAMAEAVGINPHDLITRANKCMSEVDGPYTTHIKAIREYAAGEIMRRT